MHVRTMQQAGLEIGPEDTCILVHAYNGTKHETT